MKTNINFVGILLLLTSSKSFAAPSSLGPEDNEPETTAQLSNRQGHDLDTAGSFGVNVFSGGGPYGMSPYGGGGAFAGGIGGAYGGGLGGLGIGGLGGGGGMLI